MAETDEITEFQSFAERTLKFGRNLMVAAVTIVVFAFVPVVDLAKSRPFNFEIGEGGEIWIWILLAVLLVYYGARFFALAVLDFRQWKAQYGMQRPRIEIQLADNSQALRFAETDLTEALEEFDLKETRIPRRKALGKQISEMEKSLSEMAFSIAAQRRDLSIFKWQRRVWWIADAGLPSVLFIVALGASLVKIRCLL